MPDEPSDSLPPDLKPAEPAVFFREYYASLPQVPQGKLAPDIKAFEQKYGTTHGYAPGQLAAIAKQVRAEMRPRSDAQRERKTKTPAEDSKTWERWILGVGFGIYVLASVGVLFYATAIRGLSRTWLELRSYVIGIVALGAVLFVLTYGWSALKRAPLNNAIKQTFATIVLALFLVILASAVGWLVILIWLDAWKTEKTTSEDSTSQPAKASSAQADGRTRPSLDVYLASRPVFLDDAATDGPADASVTIVLFGDFEDPFSARLASTLRTIRRKYYGKIRFAFRHYPLSAHTQAQAAAVAALAAQRQGKFLPYSDSLYEHRDDLTNETFRRLALDLGMDLDKFNSDIADRTLKERVENDIVYAKRIGIRYVPTLFVNGKLIAGSRNAEEYEQYIEKVLSLS